MISVDNDRARSSPSTPDKRLNLAVIIPTYNARPHWQRLHEALERQGLAKDQVLVVDSSSSDDTPALVRQAGYSLVSIAKESFGHGATRQMAAGLFPDTEVLIFLTQDAVPCGSDSLERLSRAFDDPLVGAACGRQLAREEAEPIERHARLFNYPAISNCRTIESRKEMGIKAAFLSNSFGAYRRSALEQIGGFPKHTIVNEDMTVAARLLMAGWKVAYQADATVIHSHPLTLKKEFSRYFDTGVYHAREKWLIEEFGGASGEGLRFIASETRYLLRTNPFLVPVAFFRNINKWLGYQLGTREKHLPLRLKRWLSDQKNFWQS